MTALQPAAQFCLTDLWEVQWSQYRARDCESTPPIGSPFQQRPPPGAATLPSRCITSCLKISNYISLKDGTKASSPNLFTLVLQVRIWSLTSSECTVTLKGHKVRGGTERGTIQNYKCSAIVDIVLFRKPWGFV